MSKQTLEIAACKTSSVSFCAKKKANFEIIFEILFINSIINILKLLKKNSLFSNRKKRRLKLRVKKT